MSNWVAGVDAEFFDAGPYESLEDALRLAPGDLGLDTAETFYVGQRRPWRPTVDARGVLEQVGSDAFAAAEDATTYLEDLSPQIIGALQRSLQLCFDAWLRQYGLARKFWQVSDPTACAITHNGEGFVIA